MKFYKNKFLTSLQIKVIISGCTVTMLNGCNGIGAIDKPNNNVSQFPTAISANSKSTIMSDTSISCGWHNGNHDCIVFLSRDQHNGNFKGYAGASDGYTGANQFCNDQAQLYRNDLYSNGIRFKALLAYNHATKPGVNYYQEYQNYTDERKLITKASNGNLAYNLTNPIMPDWRNYAQIYQFLDGLTRTITDSKARNCDWWESNGRYSDSSRVSMGIASKSSYYAWEYTEDNRSCYENTYVACVAQCTDTVGECNYPKDQPTSCNAPAAPGVNWEGCYKKNTTANETDISQIKAKDADLSYSNLSYSTMSGADFRNANLTEADLTEVELNSANLYLADLAGVNLSNAVISWSLLQEANLTRTSLNHTNLSNSDLTRTILTFSDLSGANFTGADLTEANLTGANVKGTVWHSILIGAHMSGLDLSGNTTLDSTNLYLADLSGANLSNAVLTWSLLQEANLTGASLNHANLSNSDLTKTILTSSDLTGANFTGADLTEANLTGANVKDAVWHSVLIGANMSGLDLSGNTTLDSTNLSWAHLKSANLRSAHITWSLLVHADLSGADLTGADLTGADLTGADLTGANLSGATWTDGTTCSNKSTNGQCLH